MIIKYKEFLNETNASLSSINPEYWGITDYEWEDGFLNCYQNVNLSNKNLYSLPFKFGKIQGYFDCSQNNLKNLFNSPTYVLSSFECGHNDLSSLQCCPKYIGYSLGLNNNINLKSLKYCPSELKGTFRCQELHSLENFDHFPKIIHDNFYFTINGIIDSIEDFPMVLITGDVYETHGFKEYNELNKVIKNNYEILEPLSNDQVKFHQMVMRINPDLIKYYVTIPPPQKKTILFV